MPEEIFFPEIGRRGDPFLFSCYILLHIYILLSRPLYLYNSLENWNVQLHCRSP
jgi:hypothetical protein